MSDPVRMYPQKEVTARWASRPRTLMVELGADVLFKAALVEKELSP
jgi:hypothetical protein